MMQKTIGKCIESYYDKAKDLLMSAFSEFLKAVELSIASQFIDFRPMVRTIFDKKAIHRIGCGYKQKALDR